MPCFQPIPAWRTKTGEVLLSKEPPDSTKLALPCSSCLGCTLAHAKSWAIRCQLEYQHHHAAVVTTLTYETKNLPPTLWKPDLQRFLKRLRTNRSRSGPTPPLRFFASGEYGDKRKRPHYHAILYGLHESEAEQIQEAWNLGTVRRTETLTPQAIAYVAGYVQKKIGYKDPLILKRVPEGTPDATERVYKSTGEVYWTLPVYQPPFLQMSRNPGIGDKAKEWCHMWRLYAVHNGHKVAVPQYLRRAYDAQATSAELEQAAYERQKLSKHYTATELQAAEKIATKEYKLAGEKRQYDNYGEH